MSMSTKRKLFKADEDILPDFLANSPFLPVWNDTQPKRPARPKRPSIAQVLKSKPARLVYGVLLLLIVLSWLRSAHLYQRLTGPSCYFRDPVVPDDAWKTADVDWTQYAYVLYATDADYLCNAVMIFDSLQQLGNKADRLLLYADTLDISNVESREGRQLVKARDELGVNLKPVKVLHQKSAACESMNPKLM